MATPHLVGIVYDAVTLRIKAIVSPTGNGDLGKYVLKQGERMRTIPRGIYNSQSSITALAAMLGLRV